MNKLLHGRYEKIEKIDESTNGKVYKAYDHLPTLQKPYNLPIDLPLNSTKLPSDSKIHKEVEKLISSIKSVKEYEEEMKVEGDHYVSLKKCRLFKV